MRARVATPIVRPASSITSTSSSAGVMRYPNVNRQRLSRFSSCRRTVNILSNTTGRGLVGAGGDSIQGIDMDWLWFKRQPNLQPWTTRPFSLGVELGSRPGDRRDNHERVVAVEEPGPPMADGPFRRLARAILEFNIFPPRVATGVLPQIGRAHV